MQPMHTLLRSLVAARTPFTTADAALCGIDRHALDRMVRSGTLRRIGCAAFVPTEVWADATAEQRHLLRCRAALRRRPTTLLSHCSAVIAHDLPVVGSDLSVVHLARTRDGRSGRVGRRHPVQLHPPVPDVAATTAARAPTCAASMAVLQVADWDGAGPGLVAAEAALRRSVITRADLQRARDLVRLGRGRARADLVVDLAAAHSESPGESLTRLLLRSMGITDVRQQVRIALPSGGVARVDFLLPNDRIVVEFDGAVKYEGAAGRAALVREKRREDGIRAAGYEVVRLTWADLERPAYVLGLIEAARARARRR
jgi:very-short-patch-repair endonuclease